VGGAEGQVHWIVGMAPPPPGMRIWPADNAVHVYWNDVSEVSKDIRLNEIDFESYRIWRADNWDRPFGTSLENGPASDLWQLIAEFDLINYYYERRRIGPHQIIEDTLPLGANTGLEVVEYRPVCLDNPEFAGLAEAMQQVVDADTRGLYVSRPNLRDRYYNVIPGLEGLLEWEDSPAVLDTFFMVAERIENEQLDIAPKPPVGFYEYIDRDIHNGFIYFYAVTATDHELDFLTGDPRPAGEGIAGDPGSNFLATVPGPTAQTAEERAAMGPNIYVYPNPATTTRLAEFQELHPNADDPTGLRVMFSNLPRAQNRIQVFTVDGDLVAEIDHDGTAGYGQVSWNLVSRNGQQVVSGIYLYVVRSDDSRFEDFIGKFVVIR
jgi:hypothetical protein